VIGLLDLYDRNYSHGQLTRGGEVAATYICGQALVVSTQDTLIVEIRVVFQVTGSWYTEYETDAEKNLGKYGIPPPRQHHHSLYPIDPHGHSSHVGFFFL
jgi:hypothetical protein